MQPLNAPDNSALVTRSTGSWYDLRLPDGSIAKGRLRGKLKLQDKKITNPVAVGDWVTYDWEVPGQQAIINEILPRENYIIRKSVHKTAHGHIIAANLDQALVVASLFMPRTSTGFIDRFLVSAESFRIPATVVFNKVDMVDGEALEVLAELEEIYRNAGYGTLRTSATTGEGREELRQLLANKLTLVSGHSGVGKSSLINQLAPDLALRTGRVSDYAAKGTHTTTFAEMFELEPGMDIIDTPGIKELGILEIEENELAHYFPEMREMLGQCRFHNCRHLNEPGCAVIRAVEEGDISDSRYASYLSMLANEESHK